MLKVEVDASMKHVKELLKKIYDDVFQDPAMKGVTIYYDVDPAWHKKINFANSWFTDVWKIILENF